jgi:spore germination protein YaaH
VIAALLSGVLAVSLVAVPPTRVRAGSVPDSDSVGPSPVTVPGPAAAPFDPGAEPSQMYLDLQAHASDPIAFQPGERVTVPFVPRAGDTRSVGGAAPQALPAGRLSGSEMLLENTPGTSPEPSAGPVVAPRLRPAASGLRREVYGFLPYWEVSASTTHLDWRVLSSVAYFSLGADANGNLKKFDSTGKATTGWAGWTSSAMTTDINAAHKAGSRVTLTISVFAWTSSEAKTQAALLGNPTARASLAAQAVAAVHDRGADGINLDFEPLVKGQEDNFVALIHAIRADFTAIAPGYHLTYDVMGRLSNFPLEASVGADGADAIFIMGYDYRIASSSSAGSVDPLAGPVYDLADTVAAYRAHVPANRLILGIPYYGRSWPTVSDAKNAKTQTGSKYGSSASVTYDSAVPLVAKYGRRFDSRENSAWFAYRKQNCTTTYGCVTTWRQVYYDDAATLGSRYDLVNRSGLRGVGIWALGYDGARPELYQALGNKFVNDTTPPLSGMALLPASVHDEGFPVTWSGVDDWNGVASYDVEVSVDGGAWTTWLDHTSASGDTWLGDDGHGYAFRVRARDGKGNLGAYVVTSTYATPTLASGGFGRVVTSGLNIRSDPASSAARLGTADVGAIFAITGGSVAADGCSWYPVTGPLTSWGPVDTVLSGAWIATTCDNAGNVETYVEATLAPNATGVQAGIRGVAFAGLGEAASVGSGADQQAARAFSPNGDGVRDTLAFTWDNRVALESLALHVLAPTAGGSSDLGTIPLPADAAAAGPHAATWDGRLADTLVPDGTYLLQFVGVAGGVTYAWPSAAPATAGQIAATAVTVDILPPALVSSSVSALRLSPNGDGRFETVSVNGSATGATHWVLDVIPAAGGSAVRSIAGGGTSASLVWDGKDATGARVADGDWALVLRFADDAGNAVSSRFIVTVDATAPLVGLTVTPGVISPNGDGALDSAVLRWSSSETITGTLTVLRGTAVVRSWKLGGAAGQISWNGNDARGHAVKEGRYAVRVDLVDGTGNATRRSTGVAVDRSGGQLRWSASLFYPQDGDALAATSSVSFRLARTVRTTLVVGDAAGTVVRTAWKNARRAKGTVRWTWDGRNAAHRFVAPGRYAALLTISGPYGTAVLRRDIVADAFLATPSSATPAAGSTLTVTFRSAEPLAITPTATFRQAGRAAVPMTVVRLADGTWRATVEVAAAPGPAVVAISARDRGGRTNTSTLSVSVP